MSIQLVIQACQAISDKGKQPNTALVKSYLVKSGHSLALTQIIRGIRAFADGQQEQTAELEDAENTDNTNEVAELGCSCQQELSHMRQQIKVLQAEFRALQAQVLAVKSAEKS